MDRQVAWEAYVWWNGEALERRARGEPGGEASAWAIAAFWWRVYQDIG